MRALFRFVSAFHPALTRQFTFHKRREPKILSEPVGKTTKKSSNPPLHSVFLKISGEENFTIHSAHFTRNGEYCKGGEEEILLYFTGNAKVFQDLHPGRKKRRSEKNAPDLFFRETCPDFRITASPFLGNLSHFPRASLISRNIPVHFNFSLPIFRSVSFFSGMKHQTQNCLEKNRVGGRTPVHPALHIRAPFRNLPIRPRAAPGSRSCSEDAGSLQNRLHRVRDFGNPTPCGNRRNSDGSRGSPLHHPGCAGRP